MINFFCTCILLLPWIFLPAKNIADPFRLPKETFFDLICLGMILFAFVRNRKSIYTNKYLSWFSLWVFITMLFNWFIPFTLTIDNKRAVNLWTIQPSMHFILGLFLVYIIISHFDIDDFIKIAKAICLSAVLLTAYGILQVIGFEPFGHLAKYNHPNHFSGLLDNPNLAGNYLCLAMPFFFIFKEKRYKFGMLFILAGIFLSRSVLSITTASIILIYVLSKSVFEKNKRWLVIAWALVMTSLVIILLYNIPLLKHELYNDLQPTGRIGLWKQVLIYCKDNPLFGQGLGVFKTWEVQHISIDSIWMTVHNDWIERLVEVGFVGLALFTLVIGNLFYRLKITGIGLAYMLSFVSFLILMCASFPVEFAPTALLGLIGFCGIERLKNV